MRICPYCKEEIPEDVKVCPVCNETLDTPKKTVCPYCKEEIEENVKVCPVCGEVLKKKPTTSMNISKRVGIGLGITLGAIIILGLTFVGLRSYEISYLTSIQTHEDTDPYESTVSTQEALNKMIEQEKSLTTYLNKIHLKTSKEKAFYNFLTNAEYYSDVFSYQNGRKCGRSNSVCISAENRMLRRGHKANIDGIEVAPVYGELSPPNSKYGNIKITNPEAPFIKMVFNSGYCGEKDYLQGGIGYIVTCNGSSHYVAEPNYKYIKTTYSKYLGADWKEYFDIKIKQQEDLRNSAFSNGNGGMYPAYITTEATEWAEALVELLTKYPNFIMYDNVAKQILDISYPSYRDLLTKIKKETKLYEIVKKAKDDFEAEYADYYNSLEED